MPCMGRELHMAEQMVSTSSRIRSGCTGNVVDAASLAQTRTIDMGTEVSNRHFLRTVC